MTAAGIVAEYNPFHRGHAFHLARTREALGPDGAAVCVMSGHWVQRGDCAVADKWTRSALALAGGADLVIELPTPWAMASAESFARPPSRPPPPLGTCRTTPKTWGRP